MIVWFDQTPARRRCRPLRVGTPEEIAAVVRFLCGPDARYIAGQTVHANGGVFMA